MRMRSRCLALALLCASPAGLFAAQEPAIVELRVLSSSVAHSIVLAAVQDCVKRGYKVYEVPISYNGRGYDEGKKITWRDGVAALWFLIKFRIGN